jgi:pimeloyl-ACP methyl ester carboxylesterase
MNWREFQSLQRLAIIGDRFMSYVEQGAGDPVVLIHGIPTWGYVWRDLMVDLAQTCRVLVPDLMGYGFSDKRDTFDRSIAKQAEAIDQWMTAIGVERAVMVGHDIGGGVALRLATLFPRRVDRLVLLDSVAYDSWPTEAMLQLGHPGTKKRVPAQALVGLLKLALRQSFAAGVSGELLDSFLAPCTTEVGKLSMVRNAASLDTNHTVEISPLLSKLDVPTLVIWGQDDRVQPVSFGERLAWDIPGARLVRVPGARHYVMIDQLDIVAREIRGFLFREPGRVKPRSEVREIRVS